MAEIKDRKIKPAEIDDLTAELELDLVAFFKVLESDILYIVNSEDDPDEIIKKIDKLLE